MTTPNDGQEAFEGPFYAQDGLRYASAKDRILNRPEVSQYNVFLLHHKGEPELVKAYRRAYAANEKIPGRPAAECHANAKRYAFGFIDGAPEYEPVGGYPVGPSSNGSTTFAHTPRRRTG